MIVRSLVLAGFFAVLGVGVLTRPTAKKYHVDETWLERQYPTTMGKYVMQPGSDGSTGHTYKMDATTYETLKPYGIVGRVLSDGVHSMDVVTLAGDSEESFHNPLLCFAAQDWTINWSKDMVIPTKSRGDVHATIAEASRAGMAPQYAIYTFEGPRGTFANPGLLKDDMFWSEVKTGQVQFGTFFRFMSATPNLTQDQVVQFAHDYLEASPVRPINTLKS